MKGKTIIELKDVKTGRVERHEHDNTFQSLVLEQLFKPMGALGMSMVSSANDLWKNLVGGIMAFDDEITTGAQYPPQDVNMVANGAYNVTNNTDPVELGSWNESESYVTKDEIVMTYDYSTSQGNGSIASVCLTSAACGKGGVGNASLTSLANNQRTQLYVKSSALGSAQGNHPFIDGDYVYQVTKSGLTLTVKRWWANMSAIDIIKGLTNDDYIDTYTITLPSGYENVALNNWNMNQLSETKIAFIKNNSNTNYSAVVVDVKTRNVSNEITIPYLGSGGVVSGSDTLLMWQAHTDTDVNYISIYDTSAGQWILDAERGSVNIEQVMKIGDRFYFREYDSYQIYCVNSGLLSPTNSKLAAGAYGAAGHYLPTLDLLQFGDNDYQRSFGRPSMYLATINNLEEPVVKDNTKTMKITYVLTRR